MEKLSWLGGRNTSAGEAPGGVVRTAEEGIDGACSRADVEAHHEARGVVVVGEGGGRGAGVEEILDPKEVVEAVWDLGFVSMAGGCEIKEGGDELRDIACQVGGRVSGRSPVLGGTW